MRGKKAPVRTILPDPKYRSLDVAKFVNYIMKKGKKSVARTIVYGAFELIAKKTELEPVAVFTQALENVGPSVEVKSKRVGGANYQVPIPVRGTRRFALASRWIIDAASARKGKPMAVKLADELLEAHKNEGSAIKKKNDVHRMAEANRAFAHFARF